MLENEKKILNIILFNGNLELLRSKLEHSIGEHWVFVPKYDSFNVQITLDEGKISKLGKIKVINFFDSLRNDENQFIKSFYKSVENEIRKNLFDFEIQIFVSKDYEIIDFSEIENIQTKLKDDFVVFKHSTYPTHPNLKLKTCQYGAFGFTLSQFLLHKNIFLHFEKIKENSTTFSTFEMENGDSFPFIYAKDNTVKLGVIESNNPTFEKLNLQNLTFEKISNFKNLICLTEINKNLTLTEDYDFIFTLEFGDFLSDSIEYIDNRNISLKVRMPKMNLYGQQDSFENEFKKNTILEIISKMKITKDDLFDVK